MNVLKKKSFSGSIVTVNYLFPPFLLLQKSEPSKKTYTIPAYSLAGVAKNSMPC